MIRSYEVNFHPVPHGITELNTFRKKVRNVVTSKGIQVGG
jgi:hypothetical protein